MKTIARTATRKIAAVEAAVVSVRVYDQRTGEMTPSTVEAALKTLRTYDFARLHDNENGTWTVGVHSNLWFELRSQAALDRIAAEQAARDEKRAARLAGLPAIPTESREQRQARVIRSTTSIHDLGRLGTATVTQTRKAIGTQIAEACEALGIELGHGEHQGVPTYVVHGEHYSAGQLANLVLAGGFDGSYGQSETIVREDSPLRPAAVARRNLLDMLPDSYTAEEVAEMSDAEALIAAVSSGALQG